MTKNDQPRWFNYLIWTALSFLCVPLALLLDSLLRIGLTQLIGATIDVNGVRRLTEDFLTDYTFLPVLGIVTGIFQHRLLRRNAPGRRGWAFASTGGWLLGMGLFLLTGGNHVLTNGRLILGLGLAIAIAQWLFLRRRLSQPGWWLAANAAAWGLLAAVTAASAPAPARPAATCAGLQPSAAANYSATATASPAGTKMNLLFDDDGSRDGTAALLYLLNNPAISIQAITISYGEAHPATYIQHIGCLLEMFGFPAIPLGAGRDKPLAGGTPFPGWLRQLSDDFWDYPLPRASPPYPFQDAPSLIVSTIQQAAQPVTLFMSGPLTNLAQALRLDPAIQAKISAVYLMGGAVYVPGNIQGLERGSDNAVADWNMIADPQAAKEVFESGLLLYMVPLDATHPVLFSQHELHPWRKGGALANLVVDLMDILFNTWNMKTAEVFDLTAAVLMVHPEMCRYQPLTLEVVTEDGPNQGQTKVAPGGAPNVYVCLEPDVKAVKHNLLESFTRGK